MWPTSVGSWRSQFPVSGKPQTYEFMFEQKYQMVSGSVQVNGRSVKIPDVRIDLPHWLDIEDDRRRADHLLDLIPDHTGAELVAEAFRRRGWTEAEV